MLQTNPAAPAPLHSTRRQALKQRIDILLVLVTAPLWAPLCAVLYLLIWLEDGHNPLFLQKRLGKNGRVFKTFKFRTMVHDAEEVLKEALDENVALREEWETFYKLRNDPRITKTGSFLRRTSLDELPQLINVLRGEMVLVGPRPLPAYHHEALPPSVQVLRNVVKPGITGLWQVMGRSDTGNEGMKKWDPYYVKNWSIMLDYLILMRTLVAVISRKGAY
jgi:lipopolysaccharide/colanic/teichoic acid biosynthesis glycosyltransferase